MLVQQGMTKLYSGYVQATLASFEKTIAVGQADAPIFCLYSKSSQITGL